MAKAKQYRCIKGWARNNVGDLVEAYEFFRFPAEIRQRHFVEVVESVKKSPISTPKREPLASDVKKVD